ncbi:18S rRNA pseudouridine methyltransferase [Balamuthia mandrillaris]
MNNNNNKRRRSRGKKGKADKQQQQQPSRDVNQDEETTQAESTKWDLSRKRDKAEERKEEVIEEQPGYEEEEEAAEEEVQYTKAEHAEEEQNNGAHHQRKRKRASEEEGQRDYATLMDESMAHMKKVREERSNNAYLTTGVNPFKTDEPKLPKTKAEKEAGGRLIVVLDGATLETVKVANKYQLLNCDDHRTFLRKHGRDVADARPDITHQCLLTLLDSPLNKAGKLQVYIRTQKNVLIEVNPRCRIPRTFARFSPLMVQLLHKFSIRASNGPEQLLKVIKNPITDHFPAGCPKIGASYNAEACVPIYEFIRKLPQDKPIVFVIGAIAHGDIEADYVEQEVAYSEFPLSASVACGKLCDAFEALWGIL